MRADGSEFDAIAAEYDRFRESYPDALVDAACARGRLTAGSRVLEIGCGTGQLTEQLAKRGLAVAAVDPGAQLIERARIRAGADVEFHLARFEDVELAEGAYDAVFSATAFHWIDPAVGWAKVANLLRPGGVIALLHPGMGAHSTAFSEAISAVWHDTAPRTKWHPREPFDVWQGAELRRGDVSALWSWITMYELERPEATTLFGDVQLLAAPTPHEHTLESYLALMRTTSSYLRLDAPKRDLLQARLQDVFAQGEGNGRFADWAVLVTAVRR